MSDEKHKPPFDIGQESQTVAHNRRAAEASTHYRGRFQPLPVRVLEPLVPPADVTNPLGKPRE